MVRNKLLYDKVIALRKDGKSYNEISKDLRVSKSTISDWLSNKNWSKNLRAQLTVENNQRGSNFLKHINRLKHNKTILVHNGYRLEARELYKKLKQNRLFLAGLAVYWGEGEKTDVGRVSVVNSDVGMLKLVVNFYRKILGIQEDKLRCGIFIYKDINKSSAVNYWSENLKISKEQFIKTQVLPSRSRLTKRKVRNGVCSVYFSSKEMSIKIKEWIRLFSLEYSRV